MFNFLKQLFNNPADAGLRPQSDTLPSEQEFSQSFQDLFRHHLERISGAGATHADFVRRFFTPQTIGQILEMAQAKMALSLADGDDHNIMFTAGQVCYDVTTFPMPMRDVCAHLGRKYGGFTALLQNLVSRHPAFTIQGCKILCFVAFGRKGKSVWVNMAFVSLDSRWQDATVMPVEFLNQTEQDRLELVRQH